MLQSFLFYMDTTESKTETLKRYKGLLQTRSVQILIPPEDNDSLMTDKLHMQEQSLW